MEEMYFYLKKQPVRQLFPDVKRTVLARTEHLMLCQLELKTGHMAPVHHHSHEQCSYVMSGKVEVFLENECRILQAGDSVGIRPDIEHTYHVLEDACVLEVFYPLREDILDTVESGN